MLRLCARSLTAIAGCSAWRDGKPASRWRRMTIRVRRKAWRGVNCAGRRGNPVPRRANVWTNCSAARGFRGARSTDTRRWPRLCAPGWAEAGVCVRFSADEAGVNFLPVRTEALDLCFAAALQHDPRLQALVRLLRTRACRRLISELAGYNARETGEILAL